jgi:mannosyltransferase
MATAVAPRPSRTAQIDWVRVLTWVAGGAAFLLLVAVSVYERTGSLHGSFWMDEGLSVGIASHKFTAIPGVLQQDGSPPLYYMLLHVWMGAFGTEESRVHLLSVAASTAAIPAGLWAGWSLFGARTGWILAGLCAFNPFLTGFGEEARMYAFLGTFSIIACALVIHVFVLRNRKHAPFLAVALAAMLYTHAWSIFFGIGAFAAALFCYRRAPDRREMLVDGLISFGGAAVLFLPWLPTFIGQSAHTAAPWSRAPRFGAPIQVSRGLMGGDRSAIVLLLAGVGGIVAYFRINPSGKLRTAVYALLVLPFVTLAVAWIASHVTPAWTTRYFGVFLGPLLLLSAVGIAHAKGVGVAAVLALVFFWVLPGRFVSGHKSDVRDIAAELSGRMKPQDVIIGGQPEQVPVIAYYFGPHFRYASTMEAGVDRDPYVMDWRDAVDRMKRTDTNAAVSGLVASLHAGQRVLFVRPLTDGVENWVEPWTKLVRRRSAQWGARLATDPRLKRIAVSPLFYPGAATVGNSAVLYQRTG